MWWTCSAYGLVGKIATHPKHRRAMDRLALLPPVHPRNTCVGYRSKKDEEERESREASWGIGRREGLISFGRVRLGWCGQFRLGEEEEEEEGPMIKKLVLLSISIPRFSRMGKKKAKEADGFLVSPLSFLLGPIFSILFLASMCVARQSHSSCE